MPLDDLVKIAISASSVTPTQAGFGTILIAAQKCPATLTNRTRVFSSLTEMTDAGFSVSHPAYRAAQRMKAQNPSITSWKVGRRNNNLTQSIRLTCTSAIQNDVYSLRVNGTLVTYTVPGSATTTTVATALELLIENVAGVDSVAATNTITMTATGGAGDLNNVTEWSTNLQLQDITTDPGGATGLLNDLNAILAFDNDWYGLVLDSNSEAEINVAAAFVESNRKFFVPNTSDFGCEDVAVTTDVMSDVRAAAYARTGVLYSRSELLSYSGAAWMAKQFVQAPGSDTWKFKTLAGITVDTLSAAARNAILGKNGNIYTATSGVNITEEGKSGSGEWLDVTRGVDWLRARMQFLVFSAFVNNSKIAFTDAGVDLIKALIDQALTEGVDVGLLAPGSVSSSFPRVATMAQADRAARALKGGRFQGRLAGAIHELDLTGTITP